MQYTLSTEMEIYISFFRETLSETDEEIRLELENKVRSMMEINKKNHIFFSECPLSSDLHPLPPQQTKKIVSPFLYKYFIRTCTQTRGENTENCFFVTILLTGLGKTHIKKSVFFNGRTTKVLPSLQSTPKAVHAIFL